MTVKELKSRAIDLYYQGYPTGAIANMLDVTETKVVLWLGLG